MTRSSGRAPARARLAELMDGRRRDLRLTWDEVATGAGINRETLRQIRIGNGDIRPLTATGIEDALEWARGSIEAITAGGEPTPLDAPPPSQFDQDIAATNAMLDVIERDPKARARLRRILETGSGHPPESRDSGEAEGSQRDVAG